MYLKYAIIVIDIIFLEKKLAIEDYKPTYMVESVHNLKAEDLLRERERERMLCCKT